MRGDGQTWSHIYDNIINVLYDAYNIVYGLLIILEIK